MAKTKPQQSPASRKNQKSKVDKSKSKLKNLLDAKGIASPVATQSEQINELVQRILPKHPAGFRNRRKWAPAEIKQEKIEENGSSGNGHIQVTANGKDTNGWNKGHASIISEPRPEMSNKSSVPHVDVKLKQTTSIDKLTPTKPTSEDLSIKKKSVKQQPAAKPKKSLKRLTNNSVKTHLSQTSILKSIAQTLGQPTSVLNGEPMADPPKLASSSDSTVQNKFTPAKPKKQVKRLSALHTKVSTKLSAFKVDSIEPDQITTSVNKTNLRNSNGFLVEEIAEQTVVSTVPSTCLERYIPKGVEVSQSNSISAPNVTAVDEEDIDEMILPDVRRGFTSYEEYDSDDDDDEDDDDDHLMRLLYDSDGWEDVSGESASDDGWPMDSEEESELSIGSGAEEILSDEQSFGSDSDSCPELVGIDETYPESDDSCPKLVPISNASEDSDSSQPSSDFSGYSQFSCEHSDCCGHSEGTEESYESDDSMDVEEEDSDEDDMWMPVNSDESSGDDEEYSSIDSNLLRIEEDESALDEDPHYFETERDPIIVSAAELRNKSWAKLPLDLNHSFNATSMHDTSIEQIVRTVGLTKPRVGTVVQLSEEEVSAEDVESEEDDESEEEEDVSAEEEVSVNEESDEVEAEGQVSDAKSKSVSLVQDDPNETQPMEANEEQDFPIQEPETEPQFEETLDAPESEHIDNHNGPTPHPSAAHRSRFFNSLDSRQVLLVLKSDIHFHGILKITLLAGNARIYNYSLRTNQPVTACSPRGHSFVSIEPEKTQNSDDEAQKSAYLDTVQQILTSMQSDFINQDIYTAIEFFDPAKDVLLLLEPAERELNSVNMIQRYMRQSVFPNVQSFKPGTMFYSTEFILRTKFFLVPRTKLRFDRSWNAVPLDANSRSLVIGGKGVGKSTFVRYAANASVQKFGRVLLVDLDIGQPEIFVPQTISATLLTEPILGPGYLQNKTPDRALLFGEINVTVAPLKYYRCVLQLLQFCASRPEYANVPWIVNTMGYNKGFGPELVAAVLRAFGGFTDVVQIQGHRFLDNFNQIMNADVVNGYQFNFFHAELAGFADRPESVAYRTHVFPSLTRRYGERSLEWDMSPKDSRFAIVLSNMGAMLKDGCEWITDLKPVCTSLDKIEVITSDAVTADQHLRLLNGNLVYLCRRTANNVDSVECFGIGIVRAVDPDTNKIYLLPATSDANLAATNALAVCNSPLPASLLTNHNRRVSGRVPYVYSTDNFIGSKHVVHIGYRPEVNR